MFTALTVHSKSPITKQTDTHVLDAFMSFLLLGVEPLVHGCANVTTQVPARSGRAPERIGTSQFHLLSGVYPSPQKLSTVYFAKSKGVSP
jgi:hypothetical protein